MRSLPVRQVTHGSLDYVCNVCISGHTNQTKMIMKWKGFIDRCYHHSQKGHRIEDCFDRKNKEKWKSIEGHQWKWFGTLSLTPDNKKENAKKKF